MFCIVGVLVVALSGADQYRKINSVRRNEKSRYVAGLMRKWRVAGVLLFVAQVLEAMPVKWQC